MGILWTLLWVAVFAYLAIRSPGWGPLVWIAAFVFLMISWFGDELQKHPQLASSPTAVAILRSLGLPGIVLWLVGIILFPLFSPPFADLPILPIVIFWVGHGWLVGGSSKLAGDWLFWAVIGPALNR